MSTSAESASDEETSDEKEEEESDDDEDSDNTTASGVPAAAAAACPTSLTSEALSWFRSWRASGGSATNDLAATRYALRGAAPDERYRAPDDLFDASGIRHHQASPPIRLLRLSYLCALARKGEMLMRRQDLPDSAFVSVLQLQRMYEHASRLLTSHDGVLPVVAVSACWLTARHPDPNGLQLRAIGNALQEQSSRYAARAADGGAGYAEVGVFWDVRVPRHERTLPPIVLPSRRTPPSPYSVLCAVATSPPSPPRAFTF